MTLFERRNVISACCPCPREFPGLNSLDNLGDFSITEQDIGLTLDVSRIALIQNVLGHGNLELALAPEHYDGMELGVRYPKEIG